MLRSKSRDSLRFHCKFGQKSGRPKCGRNELFSWLGKKQVLDGKGGLLARARVGFWVWQDGAAMRPRSIPRRQRRPAAQIGGRSRLLRVRSNTFQLDRKSTR